MIPAGLEKRDAGYTVKGTPIEAYEIGEGARVVLVVAGIHGNEVGTVRVARHLLAYLQDHAADFPTLRFVIIPSLNRDGFAQALRRPDYLGGGRKGRFNANGVDLNRNFPTPTFASRSVWSTGRNYEEEIPVFCGDRSLSEPETFALAGLVTQLAPKLVVSLHNVAPDTMGNAVPPSEQVARAFSEASGYPFVSDQEWAAFGQTGTMKEWCEIAGIPYLEVEGRYRWIADWESHRTGFEAAFATLERSGIE